MNSKHLALLLVTLTILIVIMAVSSAPPDSPLGKVIRSEAEPAPVPPTVTRPTPIPSAKYPLTFDQEELMFFQINLKGNRVFILGTTNVQAILDPPQVVNEITNKAEEVASTNAPATD